MTSQVVCFGCEKDPFDKKQKQLSLDRKKRYNVMTFKNASIEFKFDAKRIYEPTQGPWSWTEINTATWTDQQKTEIEVFALANQFLGFTSDGAAQNALVCDKKDKHHPHICSKTIAMVHDIGAAFGNRYKKSFGDRPRGDIGAYEKALIFKPNTCDFMYSSSDRSLPANISKNGRDLFLERAASLTLANLQTIFTASKMGQLGTNGNPQEVQQRETRWAQAVLNTIEEIKHAPCQ
jgi:hypothetical protein